MSNRTDPKFQAGRYFLSINSLVKCLIIYCDFILEEKLVSTQIKWCIKQIRNQLINFEKSVFSAMPSSEVKESWGEVWEKSDFESISRTLDYWVEMNNEQRATLELAAQKILINDFKIIEEHVDSAE